MVAFISIFRNQFRAAWPGRHSPIHDIHWTSDLNGPVASNAEEDKLRAPQGWKPWSLLPMGATYFANHDSAIYNYCTEVHLSFCNYVLLYEWEFIYFESVGEWT